MLDAETLEKYRIKRLFKLKGYFLSRTKINESIYTFMLYKGQGNKRKHYQFTTRDIETINLIKTLKPKSILRIYFEIQCREWNDKWYTSLLAMKSEVVPVNEAKLKKLKQQTDMFEDYEYKGSLNKFNNK
jgi:hypothetical protein